MSTSRTYSPGVITETEYLRQNLDSLARFYNSQVTSHVGYLISVSAFVGAICLALLSSVVLDLKWDLSWRLITFVVVILGLVLYFIPDLIPYVSFQYLLGRTQYYMELSHLTWEHMGAFHSLYDPHTGALRDRAVRIGADTAIQYLLEARLFVSRCIQEKEVKCDDKIITDNVAAFLITPEEREKVLPLGEHDRYYAKPFRLLRRVGITQADLLWLAIKNRAEGSRPNDRLLRLQFSKPVPTPP